MKSISYKFRIAIVGLLIALPMFGVTQAVAQEQEFTPELYTSELTGFDIEVSGPEFAITAAELEHYASGEGEIVTIEGEFASLEVSFFDDADTPEESIDAYLAGIGQSDLDFTAVDRGVDGDVTYAIISIHYEGVDVLYYMQVTEDVTGNVDLFETLLTLPDTFDVDLAAAQEEVTIDGSSFMETVDADEVLAALDSTESEDETATPESTTEPATPETTITIENANVELGISGEFEVDGEPIIDGSVEGHLVIADDIFAIIAVGETGLTADATLQEFSGSLEEDYDRVDLIDSADEGDSAWALLELERDGDVRLMLIVADTVTVPGYETLVGLVMPPDAVADSIERVQENLTIDGQPLMSNIDADDIVGLVGDTGVATENQTDITPEATEEVDEGSESDDPRDDAKLPTDGGADNTSETNSSETESTPEATEEPLSQSDDSTWVSPVYGNDVSWDSSVWFTDLDDPEYVESDEADGWEFLSLNAEFSTVPTLLYVEFYDDSYTAQEFLDYWTSTDYLNRTTSAGNEWEGELLSSRSRDGMVGVVVSYSTANGDYVIVREAVEMSDGTVMVITLDADLSDIVTAHSAAQDGVTVNSEPVLNVFSSSQIERLSGD